jgi:hypothetical protein
MEKATAMACAITQYQTSEGRYAKRGPKTSLPKKLPQYTFAEVFRVSQAFSDSANHSPVKGEFALSHTVKDAALQVKISSGQMSSWWGWDDLALEEKLTRLQAELMTANTDTVFLLQVTTGLALKNERVTISIDDLIKAIGWKPRDVAEREAMRLAVWRWLLIIEASEVTGQRKGKYHDSLTNKQLLTEFWTPFIRITGIEYEAGREQRTDKKDSPLRVSFVAGDTLNKYRKNAQVLSAIGDVLQIASLPSGKPTGAWARGISLALNQLWRVNAKNGHRENDQTVKFSRNFTRAELLRMYRATPTVESVLESPNPRRAIEYWSGAVEKIKQLGFISHYEEKGRSLPPIEKRTRADYQYWLYEQPLDIRPAQDTTNDILEIAEKVARSRKTTAKREAKTDPSKANNSSQTVANSLQTVANSSQTVARGQVSPASKGVNSLKHEIVKQAPGFAVAQPSLLPLTEAMEVRQ